MKPVVRFFGDLHIARVKAERRIAELEEENARLRRIGDLMQSESSRLAEWARGRLHPNQWEPYMAMVAIESAVKQWTEARAGLSNEEEK